MSESGNVSASLSGARIGFIGAGKLGSSLAIAMQQAEYPVVSLSTRRPDHRDWLQQRIPGASIHTNPQKVVDESEIVFVTASDAAISSVARSINWRPGQAAIHCSGAVPVEVLELAETAGARIGGFHPLQTFPRADSCEQLSGVTFGIEAASEELRLWLNELAARLGGSSYQLTAEQRPAYHASAVMACGLLAGLTGLAAEVWASADSTINRSQAVAALAPLVKTTANSVGENGLPNALTGPYVRGDIETIQKHVSVAASISNEIGAAYSALALAALHIAAEQGGLQADAAQKIKKLLTSALIENCETIEKA